MAPVVMPFVIFLLLISVAVFVAPILGLCIWLIWSGRKNRDNLRFIAGITLLSTGILFVTTEVFHYLNPPYSETFKEAVTENPAPTVKILHCQRGEQFFWLHFTASPSDNKKLIESGKYSRVMPWHNPSEGLKNPSWWFDSTRGDLQIYVASDPKDTEDPWEKYIITDAKLRDIYFLYHTPPF